MKWFKGIHNNCNYVDACYYSNSMMLQSLDWALNNNLTKVYFFLIFINNNFTYLAVSSDNLSSLQFNSAPVTFMKFEVEQKNKI